MCHCTNTLTESRVLCQCQGYEGWKESLLVWGLLLGQGFNALTHR